MRRGTSYFASRASAERYYADYGYDNVRATVLRKFTEGEIHFGPPPHQPTERLVLIDNGTRWAIEDNV